MTRDPRTIERTDPISEAYGILANAPFHHLVVVEGDEPVGMLSSADILRLVYDVDGTEERRLRSYLDHQFTIDDAMTVELRSLSSDATVRDAAAAMAGGDIHSVVILDDGRLTGIVTTTDLVRYVRDHG
jgi:CBS domain-containing protein